MRSLAGVPFVLRVRVNATDAIPLTVLQVQEVASSSTRTPSLRRTKAAVLLKREGFSSSDEGAVPKAKGAVRQQPKVTSYN